jgi:hypothetical protein
MGLVEQFDAELSKAEQELIESRKLLKVLSGAGHNVTQQSLELNKAEEEVTKLRESFKRQLREV